MRKKIQTITGWIAVITCILAFCLTWDIDLFCVDLGVFFVSLLIWTGCISIEDGGKGAGPSVGGGWFHLNKD